MRVLPDNLLTPGKITELQGELESLKKKISKQAEEVSRLADLGDFSENAGYQFAKGKLRGMNQRIFELEKQLNHAEVIKPLKHSDFVEIGHTVTVLVNGKEMKYKILGSEEVDLQKGIISHQSPIGSALLGHEAGEVVEVSLPKGVAECRIIKIE